MKKTLILLISALMLTGCSLKKSSDIQPPAENDDTALEDPIIEYDAAEFRNIYMPLVLEENAPLMEFDVLDLTALDIEGSRSVCLDDEEYRKEILDNAGTNYSVFFDDDVEECFKGIIWRLKIVGDKVLFLVDHDIWCDVSHDFAVYSYDLVTEELKQIYSYNGMEPPFDSDNAAVAENGDIYYTDSDTLYRPVYRIDAVTGEISMVMELNRPVENVSDTGETIVITTDGIRGYISSDKATGQPIAAVYNYQLEEYDIYLLDGDEYQLIEPEYRIEPTEGTEDRYDLVTDKVRLHTDFSKFDVVSISDSRITLSWPSSRKLFTYDLDKMERYVTEGDDLSGLTPDGSGNFYCNADYPYMPSLFVPELGTAFRISDREIHTFNTGIYHGKPVFVEGSFFNTEKLLFMKEEQ